MVYDVFVVEDRINASTRSAGVFGASAFNHIEGIEEDAGSTRNEIDFSTSLEINKRKKKKLQLTSTHFPLRIGGHIHVIYGLAQYRRSIIDSSIMTSDTMICIGLYDDYTIYYNTVHFVSIHQSFHYSTLSSTSFRPVSS